jgi:hypothetical protein
MRRRAAAPTIALSAGPDLALCIFVAFGLLLVLGVAFLSAHHDAGLCRRHSGRWHRELVLSIMRS